MRELPGQEGMQCRWLECSPLWLKDVTGKGGLEILTTEAFRQAV